MLSIALLFPVGVFASPASEVVGEIAIQNQEISILDWAKENSDIDFEIQDEVSGEVVSFRLALEILDLDKNIIELEDFRDSSSWLSTFRAAWAQHKISVQFRRIELLLRSAVRQQAITDDVERAFYAYISGTKQQIRE